MSDRGRSVTFSSYLVVEYFANVEISLEMLVAYVECEIEILSSMYSSKIVLSKIFLLGVLLLFSYFLYFSFFTLLFRPYENCYDLQSRVEIKFVIWLSTTNLSSSSKSNFFVFSSLSSIHVFLNFLSLFSLRYIFLAFLFDWRLSVCETDATKNANFLQAVPKGKVCGFRSFCSQSSLLEILHILDLFFR